MKIKGILITPNKENTKPRPYELEVNSYKDYYPLLECDTFDIQTRNFNGKYLDIYCDDEGLFKEGNKTAIVTINDKGKIVEQIVGTVFIVNHNDEGDTISLTDEEIKLVLSTVETFVTLDANGKGKTALTVCVVEC